MPLLTVEELRSLLNGLLTDDPRLLQGATVTPPPLQCVQDWPAEATDAIGYGLAFFSGEPKTVAEVEEHFAKLCYECDQILGEPAGCRWYLNWHDETPRDEMRRQMITEVRIGIDEKEKSARILSGVSADTPKWALADMLDDAGCPITAEALR